MLLLAFALAYLAMLLLCLGMSRHRGVLLQVETRLPAKAVMRLLAAACFGASLWFCIASQGGEVGAVLGFCLIMLSGILLVLLLAWRPRWVLPLTPLLLIGGAMQSVL